MYRSKRNKKYLMPGIGLHGIVINGNNAGGGGGGAATQNTNGTGGQNDTSTNNGSGNDGGNNNQDQLADFADVWDTGNHDDGGNQQPNNQTQNNGTNNQQPTDYTAMFENHVRELNLTAGVDAGQLLEAINRGEAKSLQAALEKIGANAYRHAMLNSDRLMQQRLEKAKSEFQKDSTGAMRAQRAIELMQERIPSTKNPAVLPIAKATLAQMMQKHKGDMDKAVEETSRYFQALSKSMDRDFSAPPHSRNGGNRGYNGNDRGNGGNNGDGDAEDWMQILGGQQQ